MLRRSCHTAWISGAIALFLVLALPACWYGALSRAYIAGTSTPSSNNNEEREEHEERKEEELTAFGAPPSPPQATSRSFETTRIAQVVSAPTVKTSVAPKLHVSQFSVRRLI